MLPVSRPATGKEELDAIERVMKTGWLGLGSVVFDFENLLKGYLGVKNVIAVNTGTSAIHIALDAFGVGAGDEVIVPSMTFAATIQAILATGAAPVFCEVEADTLNVDVADIEKLITPRTKAIVPVHYCGQACDMDALLALAKPRGIKVIEDAAHAFGSSYKGRKIGGFGDAACFSFDPIKNITCGEGGAVTLNDDEIAEKIRRKRILGIDKDTWHRYRNERTWFYEVTDTGYRYHMSNISAAMGIEQFKKLDKFIARKREITKRYDQAFKGVPGLSVLRNDYQDTAQFCYILRAENGRDKMMEFLKTKGVGSGVHYIPNHIQPGFKKYAGRALPVTEKVAEQIITLPLYYEMTEADVQLVIGSVKEFCDAAGKR